MLCLETWYAWQLFFLVKVIMCFCENCDVVLTYNLLFAIPNKEHDATGQKLKFRLES